VTRERWVVRNNRFGTDEAVDLVVGVARRLAPKNGGVRLVVGDLSGPGGGGGGEFHRSHQSGRDIDLLYYMRSDAGKPFEADAMHVFDDKLQARDGSGLSVDVARTWQLVKQLITAREAAVQYVFMYEPIAKRLVEYAHDSGEPDELVERARRTLHQPGDSARHDDHLHVRVYCSAADRRLGCVDLGPLDFAPDEAVARQELDEVSRELSARPHRMDRGCWR